MEHYLKIYVITVFVLLKSESSEHTMLLRENLQGYKNFGFYLSYLDVLSYILYICRLEKCRL